MSRIIDACVAFYEADGWPYERVQELPMVRSRYAGRNGEYACWFQARDQEQQLMCYCRAAVKAPAARRPVVAELFARANYGMVIGNFELDMQDGEMRYKVSADVEGLELNRTFLKNMAYTCVVTLDRYAPGMMKVIFSDASPVDILKEIEG